MTRHVTPPFQDRDNGGPAGEEAALERAVTALARATEAVHTARRDVTVATVAAYRAGMPLARIAEHTGTSPTGVQNLLDATGEPRRRKPPTTSPAGRAPAK